MLNARASLRGKRVLFVHQSASLYGSDRALLEVVVATTAAGAESIVVVPTDGPLCARLEALEAHVYVSAVGKISRQSASLGGARSLLTDTRSATRAITRLLAGRRIDMVYSNTLATLAGGVWSRAHDVPHIWHIHEIITNPAWASWIYCRLLERHADRVIFNSQATFDWLAHRLSQRMAKRSVVIENAISMAPLLDRSRSNAFRATYAPDPATILIGLVGRLNRTKGHQLLVEAIDILEGRGVRGLAAVFVGDSLPADAPLVEALHERVRRSPARARLHFAGFMDDPRVAYGALDIACVPSVLPESFGLSALEAMQVGVPVVAADNHGLSSLIRDGRTGLLFESGNALALADRLQRLIEDEALRTELSRAAATDVRSRFSSERFAAEIIEALASTLRTR
jgi:glycosyltransferase involved in cell wall biosynthesis